MNWLIVALLAPAVYASVVYVDKYLLSKRISNYYAMPVYTPLAAAVAGFAFWIFTGFPILHLKDALIVMTTGFLTAWSLIVYYKALSMNEASEVNILFQMFPLVTLLLSFFFLKEVINLYQLIGFILILSSAVLISFKREKKKYKLSSAFIYILIYDILWALSGVLMKFSLEQNSFSKIISYESFGIIIGGISIYTLVKPVRDAFHESLEGISYSTLSIIFLNEGIFVVAKSLSFFAFSLGPVSLVSVLENTQVFFGILYGWILTLLFPKIIQEDISTKNLSKKIFLAVVLFIGILLIK
jgi:transporter family protein